MLVQAYIEGLGINADDKKNIRIEIHMDDAELKEDNDS